MPSDESNLWLVAEDSDDDFFFFHRACSRLSSPPRLQRASNGLEAKQYLAGHAPFDNRKQFPVPSIVVSDLKMPLMDGMELLTWSKNQVAQIPFVLLTSSDAQSDRDRACEGGADEYLVKPGTFEDLVKTVAGVWERLSSIAQT